jgi:hypothetical protein
MASRDVGEKAVATNAADLGQAIADAMLEVFDGLMDEQRTYPLPSLGLRAQDMQFSDFVRTFQKDVAHERVRHVVDLRKIVSRPATTLDGMDTTLPVAASCIRCSTIILAARSTRRRRSKVDTLETSLADRYSSLTKSGNADVIDWHFQSWRQSHEWSTCG